MLTVGLDVHSKRSEICVLDDHGKPTLRRSVKGSPREVIKELKLLDQPFNICYEASCGYGWLHDHLTPLAHSVAVAHPGHLRLIFRGKKKNDRVGAAKLAKLLFLDEVPRVHVPSIDVRAWRKMIEHRRRLVDKRTPPPRAKNGLRALLRANVIDSPPRAKMWSKKGIAWVTTLELPTRGEALQRDLLLEEITHFDRQIQRVTAELDSLAAKHPGVTLLRTIPGVGVRTAEAVVAYIDDPKRFTRIKAIGSYFGLVPSQDQSGSTNRLGHITRQGPGTVRKLLVQAAWRGIRSSPSLRAFFGRIVGNDKDRKKIALIATSHLLSRVMLAMLRSNTPWEERLALVEEILASTSDTAGDDAPGPEQKKSTKQKRQGRQKKKVEEGDRVDGRGDGAAPLPSQTHPSAAPPFEM